jgi:hypothetical protein
MPTMFKLDASPPCPVIPIAERFESLSGRSADALKLPISP